MLPMLPENKTTFGRQIKEGDLVIVYERHNHMKFVIVNSGAQFQNKFGVFDHSDWIGKPFGSNIVNKKGGFVHILAPTPELWTLVLSHRTQILYIADISFVILFLEIYPSCVVMESGTGSGSLITSLARVVAPSGQVHTFDFHELRANSAREDFEKNGLSSLITIRVRDIQSTGFLNKFCGEVDVVFLDLPQPWLALASAAEMSGPLRSSSTHTRFANSHLQKLKKSDHLMHIVPSVHCLVRGSVLKYQKITARIQQVREERQ